MKIQWKCPNCSAKKEIEAGDKEPITIVCKECKSRHYFKMEITTFETTMVKGGNNDGI